MKTNEIYSKENIELKISRYGANHDCLTHCGFCNYYGTNDFFSKEGVLKWFVKEFLCDMPICNNCKEKLESGKYVIVSLNSGKLKVQMKKKIKQQTNGR